MSGLFREKDVGGFCDSGERTKRLSMIVFIWLICVVGRICGYWSYDRVFI